MASVAPALSPLQEEAARRGSYPPVPKRCMVTGGTGFVGQRLVEMLLERGAEQVVSFDIVPKPASAWEHPNVVYIVGDISDKDAVFKACAGMDCVWHLAAAVGPFHPSELYKKVNYIGTLNVIEACRHHGVPKIVMSSSPSTRFTGDDIDGLTEEQLPALPLPQYMQAYAETKAMGEMAMAAASTDGLLTVSVAPHQVYGPRDNLFMPNVLEAAGKGMLRVFSTSRTGHGLNRVCFTHVDNYAHALIIAERALYPASKVLGQFYIVTDGNTHPFPEGYAHFWVALDEIIKGMGFTSIWSKAHLPVWFILPIAYACDCVGWLTGTKLKLNPFNVRVLTIHRWFDISRAEADLGYKPIIGFKDGWRDTMEWFKANWLPKFQQDGGRSAGIAQQSEAKINIQAAGVKS